MCKKIVIKNKNFQIIKENNNDLILFSIHNVRNNNKISIIKNYGACIKDLIFNKNSKSYNIVPSFDDISSYKKSKSYLNSILFPFPNRINNGKYEFNNIKYKLAKKNPFEKHAIHGLVYDKNFLLNNYYILDDRAGISFIYNYTGKIKGYPFCYKLVVEYILFNINKIVINFSITNKDKNEMPFGFGFHPYFKLNKKIDELYLKLGEVFQYELDNNMIPIGKYYIFKDFIDYKKISSTFFDSIFKINSDKLSLSLYDKEDNVKIKIEENGDKLKYFQIYTQSNRNAIALEPMSCNIDVFNNKEGLKILQPDEIINFSIMISLE